MLPNCDLISAFTRADELRALISRTPVQAGTVATNITLSIGLAVRDNSSAPEPQRLLHRADLGLCKAKQKGRNRVEQIDELESLSSR